MENKNTLLNSLLFGQKGKEIFNDQTYEFVPKTFNDYIGQQVLKSRLSVYIEAALKREEALEHTLLFGPPGLGKTTLASIIASLMKSNIRITSGPVLQRSADLVSILSSLKKNDVLFIDEIHRLPITVEESLYAAMERFSIDIIMGEGIAAKTIRLPIQPFTLVGATTKICLLTAPLRSRFGICEKFDFYTIEDLAKIIIQSSHFYKVQITDAAALVLAECSRGTPRISKKLIKKIRDYQSIVDPTMIMNESTILKALEFFGINSQGLTDVDLKIISILKDRGFTRPIGLETLAILVGEEKETIEDFYEPYLIQKEYLERTPRGRILGKKIFYI